MNNNNNLKKVKQSKVKTVKLPKAFRWSLDIHAIHGVSQTE